MQLAVSIPLIVCLVTSTLPLEAQDRMQSTAGPIARGIAREAARLTVDQTASSDDVEWSRVRKLVSGSEIIVTIERAQPVERRVARVVRVVRVDESSLTLSNGQVVERVARNDVAEIKTVKKGTGVWGHLGPLGGYFVGALSGGYAVGLACQAVQGRDRCDSGAFLLGALMGGISGGLYGLSAARRETEEVIYGYKLVR
ncbi:MAG TPA: hypothetical protein VK504_02385 [Vicinamibacterales bacterium]|jgi:hypothetical protein|nr:hypothetical protein [Vicinamibacterales bacterium]